jgi:hypothetical protein
MVRVPSGKNPFQLTIETTPEVPQSAVVPVVRVFPVRPIDDRIDAEPFDTDSAIPSPADLLRNLLNPPASSYSKVAGLTYHYRTPIPVVHLGQQGAEG